MAMPVESLQHGLAVTTSHSHQTQRLCGSSGFVSRDSGVLELLKLQTFENSRFHGEIQGDCNLSSQLRAPAKGREWRRGPNAVHNQSDSRTRVGVRRTTMVVYRAAFVAMTVEFIQALIQDLLTRCSTTVCASMQRSSVFRSSLMVSHDSSTYWSGTHTAVSLFIDVNMRMQSKDTILWSRIFFFFFAAFILKQTQSTETEDMKWVLNPFK